MPDDPLIEVLTQLVSMHGAPRYLRSDNRPEFVACAILRWLHEAGIETALIDPGKPWPNDADESLNGCAASGCRRGNQGESIAPGELHQLRTLFEAASQKLATLAADK